MAITNLYPNLPGHLVEFKDGGLKYTSSNTDITVGKSLLILGTAFDGPVNEPVRIDEKTVSQVFGPDVNENGYPNGATLTKYAKQAFANGFEDVRCMRVTGSQAYTEIDKVSSSETQEIDYTIDSVTVPGNSEQESCQLSNVPVVPMSLVISTEPDGKGNRINSSSLSRYEGTFSVGAGLVPASSTVYANYRYQDISEEQVLTGEAVSEDGVACKRAITLFDANTVTGIYKTDKDDYGYINGGVGPETEGVVVILEGSNNVTLTEGVDYTISPANVLTFLETSPNIIPDDTVEIHYYTYTEETGVETITFTDPKFEITTEVPILNNTIIMKDKLTGNVIEPSCYVVNGNKITFIAGNFGNNQEVSIEFKTTKIIETREYITIRSLYGGSAYKNAKIVISEETNDVGEVGRKFTFTKPSAKIYGNGDRPFYFTSFDYPTIEDLAQALSDYALNNVFEIIYDDGTMTTNDFPLFSSTLSKGGEDGVQVNANELFIALSGERNEDGYLLQQGAYHILENYHVDYVYPAGVYADMKQTVNPNSNFHYELALLCAVLTYRTRMTHGFIDVKPNSNTTLIGINKYVNNLIAYDNIHYMKDSDGNEIVDSDGNKMDLGWYTSLVVGPQPIMISDTLGRYYGSPAIAYAALCGSLKPESAPTNKALPNTKGMKYRFSNKQMDELVKNRMVVFRFKNEGIGNASTSSTPYVVDGCTSGAPDCDYARISTVQIVTDVVEQVREVCDPFIGEPNTLEQRNAMSTLISKRLSHLLSTGEILWYAFTVNATVQEVLIGECTITLELSVPMELRRIKTTVALRPAV